MKPIQERFWNKVSKTGQCWLWCGATTGGGYGQLRLGAADRGLILAHRLSWELYNGLIPKGLLVLHTCDEPSCVRPSHLFLGDYQDNNKDMHNKGNQRHLRGGQLPQTKLSARLVKLLRKEYLEGTSSEELSKEYGVTPGNVNNILYEKNWSYL